MFHYSILTYLDSNDLLRFRLVSVFGYGLVHGRERSSSSAASSSSSDCVIVDNRNNLDASVATDAENGGSDSLWKRALERDFYFETDHCNDHGNGSDGAVVAASSKDDATNISRTNNRRNMMSGDAPHPCNHDYLKTLRWLNPSISSNGNHYYRIS